MTIELRLDDVLGTRERSAYWLSQQTGIAQNVLWKMRHQKTNGIKWDTLERICQALECQPGDLIVLVEDSKSVSKKKSKVRG